MTNIPKVTVIVPIYNVEKYLEKCIDSIINQTYTNLEIILVDDGSPDNSPIICDEYALKDNRIKVIHKENGGLSDARNAGIDAATGEYMMFVDSDDYIEPEMVEVLHKELLDNDATMSLCDYKLVYEDSDDHVDDYSPIENGVITGKELISDLFFNGYGRCVVAVCKLYKRELFDNVRFPFGKQHEDQFIFHKIALQCKKIACTSRPMYNYLQRGGSIMHSTVSIKKLDEGEALFLRAEDLLHINGFGDAALKHLWLGISMCYKFYASIDYKSIREFQNRNMEIQKLYRKVVKGIRNAKVKLSMRELVKLYSGYINLYYSIKIHKKIMKIMRKA